MNWTTIVSTLSAALVAFLTLPIIVIYIIQARAGTSQVKVAQQQTEAAKKQLTLSEKQTQAFHQQLLLMEGQLQEAKRQNEFTQIEHEGFKTNRIQVLTDDICEIFGIFTRHYRENGTSYLQLTPMNEHHKFIAMQQRAKLTGRLTDELGYGENIAIGFNPLQEGDLSQENQ